MLNFKDILRNRGCGVEPKSNVQNFKTLSFAVAFVCEKLKTGKDIFLIELLVTPSGNTVLKKISNCGLKSYWAVVWE